MRDWTDDWFQKIGLISLSFWRVILQKWLLIIGPSCLKSLEWPVLKIGVKNRPFRFENMQLTHDGFSNVVKRAWEHGDASDLSSLVEKLKFYGDELSRWNTNSVGNLQLRIKDAEQELAIGMRNMECSGSSEGVDACGDVLDGLLISSEEIHWKQRSKVLWLQGNDRNSKYFQFVTDSIPIEDAITKLRDCKMSRVRGSLVLLQRGNLFDTSKIFFLNISPRILMLSCSMLSARLLRK